MMTKLFAVGSVLLQALCSNGLIHWLSNLDFVGTIDAIGLATVTGRLYLNLLVIEHPAKRCIRVYLGLQEAIGTVRSEVDSLAGILPDCQYYLSLKGKIGIGVDPKLAAKFAVVASLALSYLHLDRCSLCGCSLASVTLTCLIILKEIGGYKGEIFQKEQ